MKKFGEPGDIWDSLAGQRAGVDYPFVNNSNNAYCFFGQQRRAEAWTPIVDPLASSSLGSSSTTPSSLGSSSITSSSLGSSSITSSSFTNSDFFGDLRRRAEEQQREDVRSYAAQRGVMLLSHEIDRVAKSTFAACFSPGIALQNDCLLSEELKNKLRP